MRKGTWQALEDLFSEDPILKAEPVKPTEITAAERKIGIPLAEDYKEFIRRYGGAIVGSFPIYGLRRSEPMGDDESSFLEVTKSFRQDHWPGTENWVVISTDFDGNPVGLDAEGNVWISDHDARAIQLLAPNFEGYLNPFTQKNAFWDLVRQDSCPYESYGFIILLGLQDNDSGVTQFIPVSKIHPEFLKRIQEEQKNDR
jgi:SMI1/KNR4 family protein SUKH-1